MGCRQKVNYWYIYFWELLINYWDEWADTKTTYTFAAVRENTKQIFLPRMLQQNDNMKKYS